MEKNISDFTIEGKEYETIVGLEVHAQLLTQSKAFCSDSASFTADPNIHISAVSLGYPGTLPKLNTKAIEYAVKMGIACNCHIEEYNYFDRKNYFYPDLPKGYQITQNTTPICKGGYISIRTAEGEKDIQLHHIHLEEDAGKSIHDLNENTLVDYNRAGVALIEIVSNPDMKSGEEAYAFLTEVRKILRYLGICDGNMEEGSMRCDANISIRPKGETELGAKVEVKNMNSIRYVKKAIEAESKRQLEILKKGEKIFQETRSFDPQQGTTFGMRYKEMANDYRYFPEPDLTPFVITSEYVEKLKKSLPALPEKRAAHYMQTLSLTENDARVLADDKAISDYFEQVIKYTSHYKSVANWMIGPIKSYLNGLSNEKQFIPIEPKLLSQLVELVEKGDVSFSTASSQLLPALINEPGRSPKELAHELNLIQEKNTEVIQAQINEVFSIWPEKVKQYKSGKKGLLGFFVGEVIKKQSSGRWDPKLVSQLIKEKLDENS